MLIRLHISLKGRNFVLSFKKQSLEKRLVTSFNNQFLYHVTKNYGCGKERHAIRNYFLGSNRA